MKTFPVDYPHIKCYNQIVDSLTIGRCRRGVPEAWNIPKKAKAERVVEYIHPLIEIVDDAPDIKTATSILLSAAHRLLNEPE